MTFDRVNEPLPDSHETPSTALTCSKITFAGPLPLSVVPPMRWW
jgi:hypothetical protein